MALWLRFAAGEAQTPPEYRGALVFSHSYIADKIMTWHRIGTEVSHCITWLFYPARNEVQRSARAS